MFGKHHKLKQHVDSTHSYTKCNIQFDAFMDKSYHDQFCVPSTFKCPACDLTFQNKSNSNRHDDLLHIGYKYECEECFKYFVSNFNIKKHISLHRGMPN